MTYDEARQRLVEHVEARLRRHPMRRTYREDAEAAVEALLTFDGLTALAEQWLDEHYPADVPLVADASSPDPGPRLAAALRDCLASTEERG